MQYKKIVIALYIRLSIEDKDVKMNDYKSESNSITNQKQLLYDYIGSNSEFNDVQVIEYQDDGYSGTNFERPKFQELLTAVRCGQIDIIIVKDFSRLGRDYLDSGNYLDKIFPAYGVRFIAINDNYDSNSHLGQTPGLSVGCRNVMNEMYSADISMKNKTAIRTRMRRGEYTFTYVVYGYERDPNNKHNFIVDPVAAQVVRRIYQLCIEGKPTREIAAELNEEGILSPSEYKKQKGHNLNTNKVNEKALWNYSKITVMLKDEKYLGKMICHQHEADKIGSKKTNPVPRDEWIVIENHHEAIITQEMFDLAQEAMSKRLLRQGIKKPLKRKNLFTCPYCNHKLMYFGGGNNRKYMGCNGPEKALNENCQNVRIETVKAEEAVIQSLNHIGNLLLEKSKKMKTDRQKSLNMSVLSNKEMLQKRLKKITDNRRVQYMKMREGKISRDQYSQIMEADINQEAEIKKQIELAESNLANQRQEYSEQIEMESQGNQMIHMTSYDPDRVKRVLKTIYIDCNQNVELQFHNEDIFQNCCEGHFF